jgi:hypothetical protein
MTKTTTVQFQAELSDSQSLCDATAVIFHIALLSYCHVFTKEHFSESGERLGAVAPHLTKLKCTGT